MAQVRRPEQLPQPGRQPEGLGQAGPVPGRGGTRDAEQQRRPQQAAENVLRFGAVALVRMRHQEPVDGLEDLVVRERSAGHPPRQQGQLQVLEGIEQCIRARGNSVAGSHASPPHLDLVRDARPPQQADVVVGQLIQGHRRPLAEALEQGQDFLRRIGKPR